LGRPGGGGAGGGSHIQFFAAAIACGGMQVCRAG